MLGKNTVFVSNIILFSGVGETLGGKQAACLKLCLKNAIPQLPNTTSSTLYLVAASTC